MLCIKNLRTKEQKDFGSITWVAMGPSHAKIVITAKRSHRLFTESTAVVLVSNAKCVESFLLLKQADLDGLMNMWKVWNVSAGEH
ncbi:MAG: hypothetical protein CFE39_16045 [Comamonadaceae bacterium PBBC2]|nr:MAG: hypothetical protein CFE39_16045 [Comamonadaceae bacterium PBBC2]